MLKWTFQSPNYHQKSAFYKQLFSLLKRNLSDIVWEQVATMWLIEQKHVTLGLLIFGKKAMTFALLAN